MSELKKKSFVRGDYLFREGEMATEAYLIRSGHVTIWRQEDGQKVHLAVRQEGEMVGEMALLDDSVRSANVTAESDVEVDVITQPVMVAMLKQSPEPIAVILSQMMEALRSSNDLISMYATRPPEA